MLVWTRWPSSAAMSSPMLHWILTSTRRHHRDRKPRFEPEKTNVVWKEVQSWYSWSSSYVHFEMSRLVTKPTKWHVRPAKTDQPGHPPSLISVFAIPMKKAWILSFPLSAQRRLWSDWVDAEADLSLRWAHSHLVGFVMRRLKCILFIGLTSTFRMFDCLAKSERHSTHYYHS